MQPPVDLLEAEAERLLIFLRASEDWEPGYRTQKDVFEKLIRLEAGLQRDFRAYFRGLIDRVSKLVKWDEYNRLKAAYGEPEVIVELLDARWDDEGRYILDNTLDDFIAIETLGMVAGEVLYQIPIGVAGSNAAAIEDARINAGELIKQNLNPTTKKLLRQSIANSIAKGHSQREALEALKEVTKNSGLIRADLIAHTEVVNSFGRGNFLYAQETGAITKEWKTSLAPCKLCQPLPGLGKISIEQPFAIVKGVKIMHQGRHPRCRCRVVYHYPES